MINNYNCYWKRLANHYGILASQTINWAEPGNMACDVSNVQMLPNDSGPTGAANQPVTFLQIGVNDVTFGGGGPTSPPFPYITTFSNCLGADISWKSVPTIDKVFGTAATTTGTCSHDTTWAAVTGEKCTASGSTQTYTFTTSVAGTVYIWPRYIDSDTGTWTYTLDSSSAVSQTTALNPAIATQVPSTTALGMIRIPNVAAGSHTLVFTQTASGTMSILAVGWVPPGNVESKPWFVVGDMSNLLNGLNQVAMDAYRSAIDSVANTLYTDGLNVSIAPVSQHVQATTAAGDMFNNVHPNDIGHAEYAAAFEDVLGVKASNPGMAAWEEDNCYVLNGSGSVTVTAGMTCVFANGPGTVTLPNLPVYGGQWSVTGLMVVKLISANAGSVMTISGAQVGFPTSLANNAIIAINFGGGNWFVVASEYPIIGGSQGNLSQFTLNLNASNAASPSAFSPITTYYAGSEGETFGAMFGAYGRLNFRPSGWFYAHCFYSGSASSITTMAAATANCPEVIGTAGVARQIGTAIASASTIAPTQAVFHVTGTTTIVTMTPPTLCTQTGMTCAMTLIPDGLWSTNTSGNFAVATTAVVGKALVETYDAATSKWYPSY